VLEISVLLSQLLGNTYFLQTSGLTAVYDPHRAVLLTLPIVDLPVPAGRSVLSAQLFTGSGIQEHQKDSFRSLPRRSDELFHVVTDYYLISFLPMVGELLPRFEVTLRDSEGTPVTSHEDLIIRKDGRELKVWEAVVSYGASLGHMPETYREPSGRLTETRGIPLLLYPAAVLILLTGVILLGIRKFKQ